MAIDSRQADTREMLLERVRALKPLVLEYEEEMEQSRRLPPRLAEAFVAAGLYKLWVPRSLGGYEVDTVTFHDIVEEISRVSGAAGWNLMLGSSFGVFAGRIPEAAAREIYVDDPVAILCGQINASNGTARAVDGGYVVNGHWAFASGILQSTWVVSNAFAFDGDEPRLNARGEHVMLFVITPTSQVKVLDTWYTLGLRGTGSNDYVIEDVFVPADRAFCVEEEKITLPGTLYHVPRSWGPPLASPAVGIALGALDAMKEMAATRKARATGQAWRENEVIQYEIARAQSLVDAARATLRSSLQAVWDVVDAGGKVPPDLQLRMSASQFRCVLAATEAVDILFEACGGTAVYTKNPLERRFRDIHTLRQHAGFSHDRIQTVGRQLLGLEAPILTYRPV